jgi:hypothetical protein
MNGVPELRLCAPGSWRSLLSGAGLTYVDLESFLKKSSFCAPSLEFIANNPNPLGNDRRRATCRTWDHEFTILHSNVPPGLWRVNCQCSLHVTACSHIAIERTWCNTNRPHANCGSPNSWSVTWCTSPHMYTLSRWCRMQIIVMNMNELS